MQVVLWLLAAAVFAQAVFAGLFLDGKDGWLGWHAVNGHLVLPSLALVQMILAIVVWQRGRGPGWFAIASGGLLVAIEVQGALGEAGQVAFHVPLGVAILAVVGMLLVRARALTRPATHRSSQKPARPPA